MYAESLTHRCKDFLQLEKGKRSTHEAMDSGDLRGK